MIRGKKFDYVYTLSREEHGLVLDVPAFPEIVVQLTEEDVEKGRVAELADDAVRNALQARIDYDDEIPPPDASSSDGLVARLPPLTTMKILLYLQYHSSGCSRVEFARSVGVNATMLSRLINLFHESKYAVVVQAFDRLGLEINTSVTVTKRKRSADG